MADLKRFLDLEGLKQVEIEVDKKDAAVLAAAKAHAEGLASNYDAAGTAASKVQELADGAVKENTEAIAKLNGADTEDGSVAKAVKDAKDALQANINTVDGKADANTDAINALAGKVGEVPEGSTVMGIITNIQENAYDDTALSNRIGQAETDIDNLETRMGAAETAIGDRYTKSEIDQKVDALTEANEATQGEVDALELVVEGNKTAIEKTVSDLTAVVDGNSDAIEALEGRADGFDTAIADRYTKGEVDSAIATAVANSEHLKRDIVEALPEVASADVHTIYMVAKTDGEGNQMYDEYMLVNGAFEKVGDTKVDLAPYAKTEDVNSAINAEKERAEAAEKALDDKIKANSDLLATVDQRIATAKGEAVTEAGQAADTKDEVVLAAAKKYADEKVAGVDLTQVATNKANIEALQGTVGTLGSDLDAVEEKAGANESAISGLTERMTDVEGKASTNESNISGLTERMGTAESDIDAIETSLTETGSVGSVIKANTAAAAAAQSKADQGYAKAETAQGEVDALEELVGAIPTTATATTVTGYVDEKAAALQSQVDSNASAIAGFTRITEAEIAAIFA